MNKYEQQKEIEKMDIYFTINQVAENRMMGYKSVLSVKKMCLSGEVEYIDKNKGGINAQLCISKREIERWLDERKSTNK